MRDFHDTIPIDYSRHTAECAPDDADPADLLTRLQEWLMTDPWPVRLALALLIVLWAGIIALFVRA